VIPSNDGKNFFRRAIFEEFHEPRILEKAKKRGYLDFKHMLYGNDASTLSLRLPITHDGYVWLCQPPGIWGRYPKGFTSFWTDNTTIYLTENVQDPSSFTFDKSKAKQMRFTNFKPKDTQNVCVQFDEEFKTGNHALTIVPGSKDNIMISYILFP
jgi:hypothetical protein